MLNLQQVAHRWPDGSTALMPLNLHVAEGEFLCLLGPSGCGKSTLLRVMAGLIEPSQGRVERPGHGAVSFVFQEPALLPWAKVLANVRLPLDVAGVPRAEADERARQALARVGLSHATHHHPHELSGGMQMRVSIARALVTGPKLLLMDEPFAALDEITRHHLDAELLRLWHDDGLTVVFVTHSLAEAAYLGSRVLMMAARPGRVVHDEACPSPWPRGDDFRASPAFLTQVARLHGLLTAHSPRMTSANTSAITAGNPEA